MTSSFMPTPHFAPFVSSYSTDFVVLAIFFALRVRLAVILFLLSFSLGTSTTILDSEKVSAYECGFTPIKDSRKIVDLKFYKVAILFILLDVELVFLFPWSIVLGPQSMYNSLYLSSALPFLGLLGLGLAFEYRRGSLYW